MTRTAKLFLTLLSSSLLLAACQSKDKQATSPVPTPSQTSSSAMVQKQAETKPNPVTETKPEETAVIQVEEIANPDGNDEAGEVTAEEDVSSVPTEEVVSQPAVGATSIGVPEQLVGIWEVYYPEHQSKFTLTYGADGSVIKTFSDEKTGINRTWSSTIGTFQDLGNGAVLFDDLGGDWHTVAQTGLGGGSGVVHTGVIFNEDGTISTKVWQFTLDQDPATYDYTTEGGVQMTRVE